MAKLTFLRDVPNNKIPDSRILAHIYLWVPAYGERNLDLLAQSRTRNLNSNLNCILQLYSKPSNRYFFLEQTEIHSFSQKCWALASGSPLTHFGVGLLTHYLRTGSLPHPLSLFVLCVRVLPCHWRLLRYGRR